MGEGAVLEAVGFCFCCGGDDDGGVDDHTAVFGGFGGNALGGEGWTEDGD